MKKIIGFVLVAIMMLSSITVFADTSQPNVTLTLDNIESTIIQYNRDLSITKENLDKMAKDVDVAKTDLDTYYIYLHNLDMSTGRGTASYYYMATQETRVKNAYLNTKTAYETMKNAYNETLKAQALAATQLYLSYFSADSQVKIISNNISLKTKEFTVNKSKFSKGYMSKKDYDKFVKAYNDLNDTLNTTTKSRETTFRKVRETINVPNTVKMTLNASYVFAPEVIADIQYEDDLKVMLEKNVIIKNKQNDYDLKALDFYSTPTELANAKTAIVSAKEKAVSEFIDIYDKTKDLYDTYKKSANNLEDKKVDLKKLIGKTKFGFVSDKQKSEAEIDVENSTLQLNADKNTLYYQYMNYLNKKNGF